MGARVAEIDEKSVAEVLSDVTVEAGDHLAARVVVGPDDLAPLFGVEPMGERRRPDEVAEEHGQLSPLTVVSGGPHQPLPVVADVLALRVKQLGSQRVEALVIQPEMFLQRAIGHSTTAAEQLDRLVKHSIEVHG